MSKKILSLLLVLVMLVGCFASCGLFGDKDDTTNKIPGGTGDDDTTTTECTHTFSSACDDTCNKCDYTREVPDHVYATVCDTDCDVCGAKREVPHAYDNNCDATCNLCNAVRTVAECADNDGDDLCDSCGANLACVHEYDNGCDDTCNLCGTTREAHTFDGVCDGTCNDCDFTRPAAPHSDTLNGDLIDSKCGGCGMELNIDLATFKKTEYNTTTITMPSNWNELNYSDGNDTQILSYIGSSFFTYDYKFENDKKFNADGSINKDAIVSGAFSVNYDAATKLEDVTSSVDAKWGYTADQKAEGGYAWKITLRNDLKWNDGTPITAADFVYSMQAQLDPAFMNFRANTYYDTLKIKNSRGYFFQNQEGTYEPVASLGYASNNAARDAGKTLYVRPSSLFSGIETFVDESGNPMPEWICGDTLYADPSDWEAGTALDNGLDAAWIFATYEAAYLEVGKNYASAVAIFVENAIRYVAWEDVGIYSIDSENAIVICLDKAYSFLNDDGSLSVWSAYYMSSLPLVHKTVYESCKKAPTTGSTLWTTNYNSSLATTASWGPYTLTQFEAGSHYRLEKNPNWYGWNMLEYQNQYNVTAINCRKVADWTASWLGFLAGEFDDASLATENVNEYHDSKYVSYSEGSTGTYGVQLYSNLEVLKQSDNNNGILAIQQFRQAFNLGLNRSDVIAKIWPGTATPCFGLVNTAYYYDIENAPTLDDGGKYRNSPIAMAGVLRAYGYTYDAASDTWAINDLDGLTLEEAYETLTGYNLTLAKQKMQEAINILLADPEFYGYDSSKKITLVYGSSSDNDKQRFRAGYVQDIFNTLTAGTALEGKIEVKFDASAGSKWSEAFRAGDTQIGFGYGFQGNAFNPFDIIGAFVNPDDELNYHMYWDTSSIEMTLTMPAGDYEGAGETITMSIQNWYFCLNGLAEVENQPKTYNWDAGFAPTEARLTILSALEEVTLKESRSIMLIADSGGSFLGAKFSNFSDEYNTFLGFGGLRYLVVEYDAFEWAEFVNANNGDLAKEYKKSE